MLKIHFLGAFTIFALAHSNINASAKNTNSSSQASFMIEEDEVADASPNLYDRQRENQEQNQRYSYYNQGNYYYYNPYDQNPQQNTRQNAPADNNNQSNYYKYRQKNQGRDDSYSPGYNRSP